MKVKDAMSKLKDKGAKQSLVVTDKAAYIVDVKNNKLVTAVDKASMNENVFTKIDSTLFVN
jgi:flagellar operon protein